VIYINDQVMDFDLQQALTEVSAQRREQALRYRHERDQRLSVAAYRLLHHALQAEYGIDQPPILVYGANGKPMLADRPDIHFSLSHCHEAAACVLNDRPIGIDIETIDPYNEEVAACVMNDHEMGQIKASPLPALAFTRLWTMKESFYKLTGNDNHGDIAHMLDDTAQVRFITREYPRFVVSVCRYLHADSLDL
jgi:4'-phosphopantetheinyl transferase